MKAKSPQRRDRHKPCVMVRIPKKIATKLKAIAKREGRTVTSLVVEGANWIIGERG